MKRAALALFLLLVITGCGDEMTGPGPQALPSSAISDGVRGGNPHFFWLAPLVSQPNGRVLGTFDEGAEPTVRLVCVSTNEPMECDPTVPLLELRVGSGIVVENDHYVSRLEPHSLDVAPSTADGQHRTLYRLEVLTPPLPLFDQLALGSVDLYFAERRPEANRLTSGEVVGVALTGSLPVRFRIDEGALAAAVRSEPTNTGDEAVCEIRCSVTIIDPAEPTLAALEDESGDNVTGVLFGAGALSEPAVLLIDERDTSDAEACAPGASADKRNCFRYTLHPDLTFNEDVRFGICPTGVPLGPGTIWRLLKWSDGELTRPASADVSDFLPCEPEVGLLRGAWDRLAQAVIRPLHAGDTRLWGGLLRDFSDLFWGAEAELVLGAVPEAAAAGTSIPVEVLALASHPREHDPEAEVPMPDVEVHFSIGTGNGALSAPDGQAVIGEPTLSPAGQVIGLRLLTGADGRAAVTMTIGAGPNLLQILSPEAVPPDQGAGASVLGTTEPMMVTALTTPAATALVDAPVVSPPGVTVTNMQGAPMPGVHVTFVATRGGGTVTGETVTTDASGQATVAGWTMGPTPTVNQLEAAVPGADPVTFEVATKWDRRLAAGAETTCSLTAGGQLYCWGQNRGDQLGVPSTGLPYSASPIRTWIQGVARLADTDGFQFYGLSSTGEAFTWNDTAVPVPGGLSWSVFSGSRLSACGVSTTGTAYCLGSNQQGEIGNSTIPLREWSTSPVPVEGGNAFVSVVAGWLHACGLTADGAAWCWGENVSGQLGVGTDDPRLLVPTPVAGNDRFLQLSLGSRHTCGITTDLRALCWGVNATGQLGDGTTEVRFVPTPVAGDMRFTAIAASGGFPTGASVPAVGWQGGVAHTCALTESGQAYCWGWNGAGQLGDGTAVDRHTPVAVSGGLSFTAIAPGSSHTCAIRGGSVSCWGGNAEGQLGIGTLSESWTPAPVLSPFGPDAP